MSRNRKLTLALLACVVIVVAAVVMSLGGIFNAMGMTYEHEDRYTAGDTVLTGQVRNLDIQWVNGKVNLVHHSGSTFELKETSSKPISADMQMRWWLDGDTLRVRYAKSGFRLSWNQEKELTLTLPEDAGFGGVSISATSGDLNLAALQAETLTLNVTSGDVSAEAAAGRVEVGATSGDIALKLTGDAESISVGTTSGNIGLEVEQTARIKLSSTSGGISVAARQAGDCKVGSTSGNIYIALDSFTALDAGATSGSVTCSLPEQPGFTAEIGTTSGTVDYTLPLTHNGEAYVCGDGSLQVKIGTTSGNVHLERAE